MTAHAVAAVAAGPLARRALSAWVAPVAILVALAAVIGLRWSATHAGVDPLVVGLAFGAGLLALAWTRPSRPSARNLALGVVAGLVLVAITSVGAAFAGSNLPPGLGRPAASFPPWAAVTILVAGGEEGLLRGRLFDATRRVGGTAAAVALTTVAFALLHVPLYGWHVVPLDLAVGLGLAGLRLATRGVAAPASAHAVADLATWWL